MARLISPASIGLAAFLVNSGVGCLLLAWNALCLRRWGLAVMLLALTLLGWLALRQYFVPSLGWMAAHFLTAALVARAASTFRDDYQGYLYDGGLPLGVFPLISLLCALQLLFIGSSIRHHRHELAETATQASSTPEPAGIVSPPKGPASRTSGRWTSGQQTVEFRDVPQELAEKLCGQLLDLSLFQTQVAGWAALDRVPNGLRVTLLLPRGVTLNPELNRKYQQAADRLKKELAPQAGLRIYLYYASREPAQIYEGHEAGR